MKRSVLSAALLLLALPVSKFHAAALVHGPATLANTGGLSLQAPINAPETLDLIDKVNEYAYAQLLIDSGEAVRNHFNDRIRWEFHLGFNEALGPGNLNDKLNYNRSAANFTSGIKLNLKDRKMVNPWDVLSEIRRLKNLLQVRHYAFSDELAAECDSMEKDTRAYLDDFWFKRWSVGVDFAYSTRGPVYGVSGFGGFNSYGNGAPGFDFANPYIYVGTDLGDYITLKAGASVHGDVMVGMSTDISTPVFALGTDFFNYLRNFSGAPQASNYPAGLH